MALRIFIILGILILPWQSGGEDRSWKFAVMGDTRDRSTHTATGISPDLPELARAIAAEKPDLVLHTGDLCNGYYTAKDSPMHGRFREMFRNWKAAVRAIYDYEDRQGIPIYPVRGNHEDGELVTDQALKKAYEEEIGVHLPGNGPEYEKGLTYSVRHKGALFVALDEYYQKKDLVLRGYINQPWLLQQLQTQDAPFIFAFCHTPAYQVGNYHQSPFPNLYSHPAQRDAMWSALRNAGASAFFCGHIHFYCRGTIKGLEQIVIGNGGADTVTYDISRVDKVVQMHYPKVPLMRASEIKTGYVVITVDVVSGKATGVQKVLNPATGKWEIGDTFTLPSVQRRR